MNVDARAYAPALAPGRRRGRGGQGLDVRRRRQRATQASRDARRAQLTAAYAEKKAVGWSFTRAYAVIKGNSTAAREAWKAAPGPTAQS